MLMDDKSLNPCTIISYRSITMQLKLSIIYLHEQKQELKRILISFIPVSAHEDALQKAIKRNRRTLMHSISTKPSISVPPHNGNALACHQRSIYDMPRKE